LSKEVFDIVVILLILDFLVYIPLNLIDNIKDMLKNISYYIEGESSKKVMEKEYDREIKIIRKRMVIIT
jgi:hypothetical protein